MNVTANHILLYPPFGSAMKSRAYSSGAYRYGFNGQEGDDEVAGEGNSWNYTFRMYNARLGRFSAVDPLFSKYPWNSSYSFAQNNLIANIDLEGLEMFYAADGSLIGKYGTSTEIRIASATGDKIIIKAFLDELNTDAAITQDRIDSNLETLEKFTRTPHSTEEAAAKDFLLEFNDNSIRDKKEYASTIRKVIIGKIEHYYYGDVVIGEKDKVEQELSLFDLKNYIVACVHTHANYQQPSDNDFSDNPGGNGDVQTSQSINKTEYLGTPNGSFRKYDPKTNIKDQIIQDLPSDLNDPTNNGIDGSKETRK